MAKKKLNLYEISFIIRGKLLPSQHFSKLIAAYNEQEVDEWIEKDRVEFDKTFSATGLVKTAEIVEEINTIRTTQGYDAVVDFMPVW